MDPNEVLRLLRELTETADADEYAANQLYVEVAEKFRALDEWMSKGGFLPDAWLPVRSTSLGEQYVTSDQAQAIQDDIEQHFGGLR